MKDDANPYKTPESDVFIERPLDEAITPRNKLVPLWIKILGWIFIVLGIVSPISLIFSLQAHMASSFTLLGLQATGEEISPTALIIVALFVAFAISAYGLLFGRGWGINAALIMGYIGLLVAIYTTVLGFTKGTFSFRLEPLIQIPYLIKLHRIRPKW